MVSLHVRHFVLARSLDRESWAGLRRLFGLCVVRPLICAGVLFIFRSAVFAWSGQPFGFHEAIMFAAFGGVMCAIMPFVESSTRRKRFALLRRKVGLRRKWREAEEEVERLRSTRTER